MEDKIMKKVELQKKYDQLVSFLYVDVGSFLSTMIMFAGRGEKDHPFVIQAQRLLKIMGDEKDSKNNS